MPHNVFLQRGNTDLQRPRSSARQARGHQRRGAHPPPRRFVPRPFSSTRDGQRSARPVRTLPERRSPTPMRLDRIRRSRRHCPVPLARTKLSPTRGFRPLRTSSLSGVVLYELLLLKPMFDAEEHLRRRSIRFGVPRSPPQLLEVKETLPGLDQGAVPRALSLNPRHRYQRAFVLREDLRGLMAGFSFADIDEVSRAFIGPIFVESERLSTKTTSARVSAHQR